LFSRVGMVDRFLTRSLVVSVVEQADHSLFDP
jgi:hypothetical protein